MTLIALEAPVQEEVGQLLAGVGYRPVSRTEMNKLRQGRMDDAIVEPLLLDALQQVNEDLSQADAALVASHVRRIVDADEFMVALRDGLTLSLAPDEPDRTVRLVDLQDPKRNDYVVTPEFEVRAGTRKPRFDVVCLVNGLPLGLVETKAPTESWKKAARDFAGYWKDVPQLEVFGAVCIATNGTKFRVAPSGVGGASAYSEWKDTWPQPMPDDADEFTVGVLGVLDPYTLVDLAAHFIVFETRDGKTTKKLARYQQHRAANKIVRRVVAGELDRGIIWHTQGSGKSLTMVFAARKLMRVGLDRPTVLVVIDRRDLDQQINETLEACSFDGVARALSREDLGEILGDDDRRGVVVTTVQKFTEGLEALQQRPNVIVFVDEAHRSQEGDFGIRMRAALPNAKLFAFTGTPIETTDRSTRKAFSPVVDGKYENYLDAYSIKQAIMDGATAPIAYDPGPVQWNVEGDAVDEAFEREFGHLSEDERAALKKDAARRSVVAKTPERVEAIAADVAKYLAERTAPAGFKAQLVAVDREACVAYAEALEKHLEPQEFAVIYSGDKDDDERRRRWYASAQWKRLAKDDGQPAGGDLGEQAAMKKVIELFKKPGTPLKLLIVNNMLLTGFDAPIEQVMFLDRGLKAHSLLQAIARTNRPTEGKTWGVVVDYWGIFTKLEEALAEFSPEDLELAAVSLDELRERFPVALAEAHAVIAAMPPNKTERQQMAWLVDYLGADDDRAQLFDDRVHAARALYDALGPDPFLVDYLENYKTLMRLFAVWRHGLREDDFDVAEFRGHTHALVQDAISVEQLRRDLPIFRVDETYLGQLEQAALTPDEKAAEIEAALVHEIKVRGEHDPLAQSLAERLRKMREQQQRGDQLVIDRLKDLESVVTAYADEQKEYEQHGLSERAFLVVGIGRTADSSIGDDALIDLAREVDAEYQKSAALAGWERDMKRLLWERVMADKRLQPLLAGSFVDDAVEALVAAHDTPAGASVQSAGAIQPPDA
jgi:type I restriction enzyme R subunit